MRDIGRGSDTLISERGDLEEEKVKSKVRESIKTGKEVKINMRVSEREEAEEKVEAS